MKANEAITLDACLLALLHYSDRVPTDMHQQIQEAKAQLSAGHPNAVKHLKRALGQDEQLKRLYIASRQQLIVKYSQQERAKSAVATLPMPSPVSAISYAQAGFTTLEDIAAAILSSPDANYRAKAQQVLNQPELQKQMERAPKELQAVVQEFAKAANQLHPTQVAMMKKIEGNFFSLDDIAYSLQIPVESAQRYGKVLWNEGYIRPISNNLLKQLWWSLKGAPPLDQPPNIDTVLTLTNKGYFYLHPGTLNNKSNHNGRSL